MVLAGQLPPLRGLILFPAQLIQVTNTTLAPGVSIAQGVFIEMFLTCQLLFVVLMLAAEKSKSTFLAPVGIGLALFVAELAGTSCKRLNHRPPSAY